MPGQRLILISNTAAILLLLTDLKNRQNEVNISKLINARDVLDLPLGEVDGGDFNAFDGLDADED